MRLNQFWSRLFVIVYLVATLMLRIAYESELGKYWWISLVTGFLALLFIWALGKSGTITTGWFWFEKYPVSEEVPASS